MPLLIQRFRPVQTTEKEGTWRCKLIASVCGMRQVENGKSKDRKLGGEWREERGGKRREEEETHDERVLVDLLSGLKPAFDNPILRNVSSM